jgi:lysophospholipase L1-like esterase
MAAKSLKDSTRIRSFFILVLVNIILLLVLESSTRIVAFLITKENSYLLCGFYQREPTEKHVYVYDDNDTEPYYLKCVPSNQPGYPVNSHGFRGYEPASNHKGLIRIVCAGASTTYGINLPLNETYPFQLEQQLAKQQPHRNYEVLNAGFATLILPQVTHLIRKEMLPLEPDIIILMSFINNLKGPFFGFFGINDQTEGQPKSCLVKLKNILIKKSLLANLIDKIFQRGFSNVFQANDWNTYAQAVNESPEVWAQYEQWLMDFIHMIRGHRPDCKIYIAEQAWNVERFPMLQPLHARGTAIMRVVADRFDNVETIPIHDAVMKAYAGGSHVWISETSDPVHLSGVGNSVIAAAISEAILEDARY